MKTDMLILILGTFSKENHQTCSKDTQQRVFVVVVVVFFIVLKNITQPETSVWKYLFKYILADS